jgi:hypothetical protein
VNAKYIIFFATALLFRNVSANSVLLNCEGMVFDLNIEAQKIIFDERLYTRDGSSCDDGHVCKVTQMDDRTIAFMREGRLNGPRLKERREMVINRVTGTLTTVYTVMDTYKDIESRGDPKTKQCEVASKKF